MQSCSSSQVESFTSCGLKLSKMYSEPTILLLNSLMNIQIYKQDPFICQQSPWILSMSQCCTPHEKYVNPFSAGYQTLEPTTSDKKIYHSQMVMYINSGQSLTCTLTKKHPMSNTQWTQIKIHIWRRVICELYVVH